MTFDTGEFYSRAISFLFGSDSFNDHVNKILNTSSVYLSVAAVGYDGHLGYHGYLGWGMASTFSQTPHPRKGN
jgi:hypothetical protein